MTRLKLCRLAKNLPQHQLARRADLPQHVVSQIENGRRRPEADELRRLAHALGVKPQTLQGEITSRVSRRLLRLAGVEPAGAAR